MRHRMLCCFLAAYLTAPCCALHADESQDQSKLPQGYIAEAPLPEGFPPPSEVGKVGEKEYPLARSYSATGNGAFMQCFVYLAKHKHEMTAPVVIEYPGTGEAAAVADEEMPVAVKRMHFLLEKIDQDAPKKEGTVTVADMPRMRVVSVAYQGKLSPEVVVQSEAKLKDYLTKNPRLKANGQTRILGYNGPSVPAEKVFWEIQMPVEAAAAK